MSVIIFIVIFFIIYHLGKFILFHKKVKNQEKEDELFLTSNKIEEEFSIIIQGLNKYCYNGKGETTIRDKRTITLYKENSCQIIHLQYFENALKVTWKFKYYQQEMIESIDITNVSLLNNNKTDAYNKALRFIIENFYEAYIKHKAKIDSRMLSETTISNWEEPTEKPMLPIEYFNQL